MISRDNWRTGDYEIAENLTFEIVIPDIDWVKRALMGALLLLTEEYNWDEKGTATPYQTTKVFTDIYNSLRVP